MYQVMVEYATGAEAVAETPCFASAMVAMRERKRSMCPLHRKYVWVSGPRGERVTERRVRVPTRSVSFTVLR